MNRSWAAIPLIIAVLFAGLAIIKRATPSDGGHDAVRDTGGVERQRTRLFWEIYRRANNYRVGGATRKAIAAYTRALELNEVHEDALYYLGNMHFSLAEFPEAEHAWQQLVEISPHSARGYSRLGDLYLCSDPGAPFDVERARAAFQRSLEINQEETGPQLSLGEVALFAHDTETARSHFDAVLRSNNQSTEAYYLNGYVAWLEGTVEEAKDLFVRAVETLVREQPGDAVPGEGDTDAGSTPLLAEQSSCLGIQAHIDNLSVVDPGNAASDAEDHYGRLDVFLTKARLLPLH